MPTAQTLIAKLPYIMQRRYGANSNIQFVNWINDCLDDLAEEDFFPNIDKEAGVEVENDVWIRKPYDYRHGTQLYNPLYPDPPLPFGEVQGKIKLLNQTFNQQESPDTGATNAYAVDSVTIDTVVAEEDGYENYLLVPLTGTYLNKGHTYVLRGNDATAGGNTKLHFTHALPAAFDGAMITTVNLIEPGYWLMLQFGAGFAHILADTEEIPVDDALEKIVGTWLHWKAFERVLNVSQETRYWGSEYERKKAKLRAERLRGDRSKRTFGRALPGLNQRAGNRYAATHKSVT